MSPNTCASSGLDSTACAAALIVASDPATSPAASIVRRSNGQSVVFEHVRAELFAAREVRIEPLDGDNVLIVAGLEPGKRIVAQAASLIDQVR